MTSRYAISILHYDPSRAAEPLLTSADPELVGDVLAAVARRLGVRLEGSPVLELTRDDAEHEAAP